MGEEGPRVLVAAVGYWAQGDLSIGPRLVERLRNETWPDNVTLDDLSYDPIAVVHNLADVSPPYERLVLVGAIDRGRPAGEVTSYRWDHRLPPPDEIQQRIGEALSGVVDLYNLLVITEQLGDLPEEVYVVEVQPGPLTSGLELSPVVETVVPELAGTVRLLAESPIGVPPSWLRTTPSTAAPS